MFHIFLSIGSVGSVDGANFGVMPFHHYDRARSDKFAIRLLGGNHNHFNTSWPVDDAKQAVVGGTYTTCVIEDYPAPNGENLVSGDDQLTVAKAYITAFLALVNDGDTGARAYFLELPVRLRPDGVNRCKARRN
jgi:hypothetical protein